MKKTITTIILPAAFTVITVLAIIIFASCEEPEVANQKPVFEATPTAGPTNEPMTKNGLAVTLDGIARDTEGDPLTYQWSCTAYNRGSYNVTNAESVMPGINGSLSAGSQVSLTLTKAGTYVFVLTATDAKSGATTSSPVEVVVNPYIATKTVTATIPGLANLPATTVNLAASYSAAIAGGDFEDGDFVYTVTDGTTTWDSTTGYVISAAPYVPNGGTFTLTYKYKDGTVINSSQITISTLSSGGGRFAGVVGNSTIELSLEKTIADVSN